MTNGPRIISIIPYKIFPAKLGGEKGIALFNEYLSQLVPITAISTKNNNPDLVSGYTLLNIISNSKLRYINFFLYFRIRKIILKQKTTHLLIEHPYYGWLAWLIRNTLPVKWVVHSHNIEYMRSKSIGRKWWKALKWYEAWVYRKADCTFFISEDDRDHAMAILKAPPGKSHVATYGIEQTSIPNDKEISRKKIQLLHGINKKEKILLFNGALYHSTNYDALTVILEKINPLLLNRSDFSYKIIVCGKGLPEFFNQLKEYKDKNIIYAGFVEDIAEYFKAADIFMNPILSGGGVKTKAIEALSVNCTVVSTVLGAMGIKEDICGNKLQIVQDNEWKKFADLIISCSEKEEQIPPDFYLYYAWPNIVKRVSEELHQLG